MNYDYPWEWRLLLRDLVLSETFSNYPWWVNLVIAWVSSLVVIGVLWFLLFVLFPRILRTLKRLCDSVR